MKVSGAFRENDLTCRPNMSFDEVAAIRSTVPFADHGVSVDGRFAFVQGDIAEKREELKLFVKSHGWLVLLALLAKPGYANRTQSAHSLEARG